MDVGFAIRIVRHPIRRSRVPASSAAGVATDVQETTFGVRAGPRVGWHFLVWRVTSYGVKVRMDGGWFLVEGIDGFVKEV